jgi:Bardet-Biedl syndrome 5 protein
MAIFSIYILFKILQTPEENLLRIDDIEEIDAQASSEINSKFTAYLTDGDNEKRREPFYCKELGFAMEKLKDGYAIKDLWDVMGSVGR